MSIPADNPNDPQGILARLNNILRTFFTADDLADRMKIQEPILQAIGDYSVVVKLDRTTTKQKRLDRENLIRCLKELDIRLDPYRIPAPLWEAMRAAYALNEQRRLTLGEEVGDLLIRARYILALVEAAEIPTPPRTNPGKPKRRELLRKLSSIFDQYAAPKTDQRRKRFVKKVLDLFDIQAPRL